MHRELADQADLAIEYLDRAAGKALSSHANRDAIGYALKAIQLAESGGTVFDAQRRSTWEVTLGDAYHELRDFEAASRHYENAMKLLGHQVPATPVETIRSLVGNAARQVGSRIRGAPLRPARPSEREEIGRAAHVYERLSEEYFFLNDSLRLLNGTLASLNLAERCGSTAETISGYNALALGLGMSGMVGVARYYSRRAFQLAAERGGKPDVARANLVAGVLASGLGESELAASRGEEAAALFRELGDRARLQNAFIMVAFDALLHGDFVRAERLLDDLTAPGSSDADDAARAWRLCARAIIETVKGGADAALMQELRSVADRKHSRADQLLCFGVLASTYEGRGDFEAALEAAERGLDVLKDCRVVWAAYGVYGAAGIVGVLVGHWERAVEARVSNSGLQAKARTACNLLLSAARTCPVCYPVALLLRGRMAFLDGRRAWARRNFRRAVGRTEKLNMRYFTGVAWRQIGKYSAQDNPARRVAFTRAEQAFGAVGAVADLASLRMSSADRT